MHYLTEQRRPAGWGLALAMSGVRTSHMDFDKLLGRFALLRAKSKAPPGFLRDKARILRDLRTEPAFA